MNGNKIREHILKCIPENSIVPEHTPTSHHYRCHLFEGSPLLDSVTTKTGILDKGYLKKWAIGLTINYIRDNISELQNDDKRESILAEASNQSQNVLEDAGDVGTRAHNVIENYINKWIELGKRPTESILSMIPSNATDVRVMSCVSAVNKFFDDHEIIPIYSELLVASNKLKTAGTMDFLCYIGDIIDEGDKTCEHDYWQRGTHEDHVYCIKCNRKVNYELSVVDWKTSNSIKGKTEYALQTAAYMRSLIELTDLKPKQLWVIRLDKTKGVYEKGIVTELQKPKKVYEHIAGVYEFLNDGAEKLSIEGKEKIILQL